LLLHLTYAITACQPIYPASHDHSSSTKSFHSGGVPLPFNLQDFWKLAAFDLLSNALRGVVAEFLVAKAIDASAATRVEWMPATCVIPNGARLEVRGREFVQTWPQSRLSTPTFDIGREHAWDAATNTYSPEPCRASDAYVFALHAHTERTTADALDVLQWQFYVMATATIEARCNGQKRIGLASLRSVCESPVPYLKLVAAVDHVLEKSSGLI
jgi:hypothetical protein